MMRRRVAKIEIVVIGGKRVPIRRSHGGEEEAEGRDVMVKILIKERKREGRKGSKNWA